MSGFDKEHNCTHCGDCVHYREVEDDYAECDTTINEPFGEVVYGECKSWESVDNTPPLTLKEE